MNKKYIDKLLYKSNYIISESPKYNQILDDLTEDDLLPNDMLTPISKNDSNVFEANGDENVDTPETPNDEPEMEIPNEEIPTSEPEVPIEQPIVNDSNSVDEIQNDIIRLNISTMKKIHSEIENLNSKIEQLSTNVGMLSSDVEEVKEPTDSEKLLNRKNDSHPYYKGLSDMWGENNFNKRQDQYEESGMRKLDDGTYIADFDTIKNNMIDLNF